MSSLTVSNAHLLDRQGLQCEALKERKQNAIQNRGNDKVQKKVPTICQKRIMSRYSHTFTVKGLDMALVTIIISRNHLCEGVFAVSSPRLTRSQNLRIFQTRPIPRLSSQRLTPSSRSFTLPLHLQAIHWRRPSLTLSFSMAFFLLTRPGAIWTPVIPGTHSFGSTHRSTRVAAVGRHDSRWDNLIDTKDRASRRDKTDLCVMKMWRCVRLASDGREGEKRSGGRMERTWRKR